MSDYLVECLWKGVADVDQQQAAAERIEELEATLEMATVLAQEVERRMVDPGGFDHRFTLREALEAYRVQLKGEK